MCSSDLQEGRAFFRQAEMASPAAEGHVVELAACPADRADAEALCVIGRDLGSRTTDEAREGQGQKMEALGRLAGGAAHEFNNVLTTIMGFARMALKRPGDAERVGDCLREIVDAGTRATEFTQQMLAFGRPQATATRVMKASTAVRDCFKMLESTAADASRLRLRIDDVDARIKVDPAQITQCLTALAMNVGHGDASREIEIRVDSTTCAAARAPSHGGVLAPGRYVRIAVTDDGPGIDPRILPRIFEPYFAAKERRKQPGLGLALVYGIVRNCGGAIDVTTAPGAGATFSIYLPITEEPMEHEGATEPQDQFDELLPASSLLVAEDDPQLRRFVSRALELDGFKVVPVCDGEAALAAFRNAPDAFDLVLTDAVMPRMDGLTLVKEITAQRPEQKVVFMSGYSAKLQEMMASAPEGMTFIQKPFDPEHLTQSIRRKLREPAAGIPS